MIAECRVRALCGRFYTIAVPPDKAESDRAKVCGAGGRRLVPRCFLAKARPHI
jgi:hypothetical protein